MVTVHTTRVYIQQNSISHYREALFELLSSNKDIEFTFIADSETETPFIKVVRLNGSRIRCRYAKTHKLNLSLNSTLFWQPGALAIALKGKPDLVIANGNPYSVTAWALLFM